MDRNIMAIITLAEVKAILQITDNTYDTLITTLIPIAETSYVDVRGIDFFISEVDLTNGSAIIDILDEKDLDRIKKQDRIETRADNGSNLRGLVTYIDFDESQMTLDSSSNVTESQAEIIIYPGNSDYAISKIIAWMIATDNATGLKAETFGTYNYTKFDSASGLPIDITKLIKRYQTGHP
jgi:hypothetical protein